MTITDGTSLTDLLSARGLFLTQDEGDATGAIYLCVRDGLPGGYPIGYALPSRAGTWFAYARSRPGRIFACDQVDSGLWSPESALRSALAHARYGDVLYALEQSTGTDTTYTVKVPRSWATHLTALPGVTVRPAGPSLTSRTLRLTAPAVALLRGQPERDGCHADLAGRLWLAGVGYELRREVRGSRTEGLLD
ncbi:hypothetical protein H9Y04_41465 [Streptomyces sp. TRM66268-LWL]|uniref:Uncharacterized protein n=1 Tax=Streptomyces polyasparticus TaxID=2767826 RepID=A0ABR7SU57_9ACTN|nr:hypothetical protein [Streptomyces polyasparticus]MBC9719015.1 hypothetical protein [Streptomyces polyasparticus]